MAFSHGAAAKLYANGYQLSRFLQDVNLGSDLGEDDVTCIGQTTTPFYKSFLAGSSETILKAEGLFDGSSETYDPTRDPPKPGIDYVLNAALGAATSPKLTYLPYGDGFGYYGYGMQADESKYDIVKVVDQVVKVSAEFRSDTGLERGVILEADGTVRSSSSSGTSVNQGASSSLGASAILQARVWSGGGSAVVKVQHSSDNVNWVDLITFSAVSAEPEAQRVAVTGTVNQYVRADWTLEGGTSIVFQLLFCRKA